MSHASMVILKILQARVYELRTSRCISWIEKRQRNQRSNCQHLLDNIKSKRIPEKHLLLLHWLYQSICVDHNKLWKILQEMGIPDHLTCLLRNHCAGQNQQLELNIGQWTGSKLGKEYVKAVYYHPPYYLISRVHHVKCQARWITSWNQDWWEK